MARILYLVQIDTVVHASIATEGNIAIGEEIYLPSLRHHQMFKVDRIVVVT